MAFRIEKRAFTLLTSLALLTPAFAQREFRYEVWHGHSLPPHIRKAGGQGTLIVSDTGVSFAETYKDGKTPKHPHVWRWDYQDIQQLKIAPKSLTVLTYKDNKWKLGADREYEFDIVSEMTFADAYNALKSSLDQRFVAAMEDTQTSMLWEIPVKHLRRIGGDEGVLQVGPEEIAYKSAKGDESRSWRFQDIDNISSSGPFQLTITSFERARMHYGSRKSFEFELKQRLEEARYNDLWLRLNRSKGLQILDSYRAGAGVK
jgi:hypothetical protein